MEKMMLNGDLEGARRRRREIFKEAVGIAWAKHDTPFTRLYETILGEFTPFSPCEVVPHTKLTVRPVSLGGSLDTIMYDCEQVPRMWILRVKINSWSQGVDETIRERNRNLLEAYIKLPPCRVWLYTHHLICMRLEMAPDLEPIPFPPMGELPVDIVAKGKSTPRH